MTGTASELIDYNENNKNNPINFELFSAWLFGNINADCLLNEITHCGCSLRIPKDSNAPGDTFNLLVMSPDNDKKLHTVITAEIRWTDRHSSANHDIAGIRFIDVESDTRLEIESVVRHLLATKNHSVKCCLMKK